MNFHLWLTIGASRMPNRTDARRAVRAPLLLAAVLPLVFAHACFAQLNSSRPIRVIVPFAAGGQVDLMARLVSGHLATSLGQPVVVENRPGASGLIGMNIALAAAPDAHTLVMASATSMAILPHALPKRPYDPFNDFTAISLIASSPYVLVVQPAFPAGSIAELVQLAKSKPRILLFGSAGQISGTRLSTELFNMMAGTEMVHVAYKGSGPATIDLLGGQISLLFNNLLPSLPHIKSGRLRALGVTTRQRNRALPDVPAIAEVVAGYESDAWNGLVASGRPPRSAIARLNQEIVAILNTPAVKASISEQGSEALGSSPEEFTAFIRAENERWSKVLSKIKLE